MKLTNDDKLAASIAMLRGDEFSRGHAMRMRLYCRVLLQFINGE